MKIAAIKGMSDILPPESSTWEWVEAKARDIFRAYGFEEVRTPIVELTELFVRSVGETSAIVEKEMYTFSDKKGLSLSLRPEGTAPVVRAYIEAGLAAIEPIAKFFYFGPMFRYEQPQKGRSRQFYQIGAELLGTPSPLADAELLILLVSFFRTLGIEGNRLEINSLGCQECRPAYLKAVHDFLKGKLADFCADCQRRAKKNPLRVLDCKNKSCGELSKEIPLVDAYWCQACQTHYSEVRGLLIAGGVAFKENRRIVRGLDYYCRSAFEILNDSLGAQNAVAAGGRYDGLVKDLGGPQSPGVGFAIGMERLMILLEECEALKSRSLEIKAKIFFALLGSAAEQKGLKVMMELRGKKIPVESGYGGTLKSQLRRASKLGAERVVILGDDEIQKNVAIVKEMSSGKQQEVLFGRLVEVLS